MVLRRHGSAVQKEQDRARADGIGEDLGKLWQAGQVAPLVWGLNVRTISMQVLPWKAICDLGARREGT